MYQEYWGLRETAFASGLDRRHFYRSPTHDEALARLHYLVAERRRLGILLGESGAGKTLLLDVFAAEIRKAGGMVGRMNLVGIGPQEFLGLLTRSLGIYLDSDPPAATAWRALADRLNENRHQEIPTIVLLDDADGADRAIHRQIVRLAELNPSAEARLTLVLASMPHGLGQLGDRLLSMAELRIDVPSWEAVDTCDYVTDALLRAGRESPIFTQAALLRLHELSGGVPRRVNQLADFSLLAAAGQGLTTIDEPTVDAVFRELGVRLLSA
jgi:type II secretory pathway predicted ATPase ExeA